MKVLEFPNGICDLQLDRETVVVMAHQRKVILLDDSEEMWKIKYILEELAEKADKKEPKNYDFKGSLRILVDGFEEESYMVKQIDEYEGRKLKVVNPPKEQEIEYDSKISVYHGVLNSSDLYIEPSEYKVIADELIRFANESGRCKPETIVLIHTFAGELLKEYEAHKNNDPFFEVIIEED